MARLPDEVIGSAYTTDGWPFLESLVEIGDRMAGHEGEHEAAQLLADRFESIGLENIERNEFDIHGWWRDGSSLRTENATLCSPHEIIALPGSPTGSVTGELVDLGHGMLETIASTAIDDKIAMARSDSPPGEAYVHRMVKYAAAVKAGASGFVYANHVEGCLPPTGDVGYHGRSGEIPAIGISKETYGRLARYCQNGTPEATLEVESTVAPTTSVNVQAELGPPTDSLLLVTAHIDAHDISTGAVDNGVGCLLLTEAARLLAQRPALLDTRVRFIGLGAEEVGLFGAYEVADSVPNNCLKCVVNIDGAGYSRDPEIVSNQFDTVASAVETALERLQISVHIDDSIGPHADDWAFVERGIPAVRLRSASETAGRGWGHTHADTLDKIDRRDLRDLAVILAETIVELSDDDWVFDHVEPDSIRTALDENDKLELTVGNRWHFD